MTIRAIRTTALSLVALGAFAPLVACNSGGEPSDPQDQVSAVQSAISNPSGVVSASTMKGVSSLYANIGTAQPVMNAFAVVGNPAADACLNGSAQSGKYDLSCATQGQVSGSMTFEVKASGSAESAEGTIVATFTNACSGNVCVSGDIAAEAKVTSGSVFTTVAYSADVTSAGHTTHVFYGQEASVESSNVTAKIALFDDKGDSYVIDAEVSGGAASYSVKGANGSFDCSISGTGGQCSGSASFQF